MTERVHYDIKGQTSGWSRGPFKEDKVGAAARQLADEKSEKVSIIRVVTTVTRTVTDTVGPK